jgi:hypothetical protein
MSDAERALLSYAIVALGSFAGKLGEALREIAVLLGVFYPLERFVPQTGTWLDPQGQYFLAKVVIVWVIGLLMEWVAVILMRVKKNLEVTDGDSTSNPGR